MKLFFHTIILSLLTYSSASSFDSRLRDISYAYGVSVLESVSQEEGYYESSIFCEKHGSCKEVLKRNLNTNICITYGDAVVRQNGNIFSGIMCPQGFYLKFKTISETNKIPLELIPMINQSLPRLTISTIVNKLNVSTLKYLYTSITH